MGRWEPGARGRLEQAAMELYLERGYDQTTVAEIAARAGLTERTFFRQFTDKREVLFSGSGPLLDLLTSTVASSTGAPLEAVAQAFHQAGLVMQERRAHSLLRRAVISANVELQERELIKLATWAAAMGEALRGRGVEEPAASLAAEAGVAVFRVAFARWQDDPAERPLTEHLDEAFSGLSDVAVRRRRSARAGR